MSIEERVERLERGNRIWKRLAFVLLAALGLAVLVGQAKPDVQDEVVAHSLRLVDDDGFAWLVAGRIKGNDRFQIRQKDSPVVVQLSATEQGAGLTVWDKRPSVVSVTRDWDGKPTIYLAGPGRSGVGIGQTEESLGVRIYDEAADLIWQAPEKK